MKRFLALVLATLMLVTVIPTGIAFAAVDDGLVLHYEMKDNTGVIDSVGDYDGTLVGNATWVDGIDGYAVQLAGGGEDYIRVPNAALTQSADVTISMWVRMNSTAAWMALMTVGSSNSNYAVLAAKGTPSGGTCGLTIELYQNGANKYRIKAPAGVEPAIGEWNLVTYTQTGTNAALYLNETLVCSGDGMIATIKGIIEGNANSDIRIGDTKMFGDPNLNGAVGEVRIYNRAISAQEVATLVTDKEEAIAKAEKDAADAAIKAAADELDLGDLSDVTADIDLPDSDGDVTINWTSSNEKFVSSDGTVTFPTTEDGDQEITLTAVLSHAKTDLTMEKKFTFTLKGMTQDERDVMMGARFVQRYVDYILNDGYELLTGKTLDEKSGETYGCEVAWKLTEGEAELRDGKLYKTDDSAERQAIKLEAVVSKGDVEQTVKFENVTLIDKYAAYILSFFGGMDDAQKLHLAYSYDGMNWQAIKDGYTVLPTTVGNGTVRDPYIMRKKDGSFAVVATQGWDTPQIYLWNSEDLVNYTDERLVTVTKQGVVGLTGARAWAPEASYDPINDQYLVYWSDPRANGGDNGVCYANSSPDLNTFSDPFILFDPGYKIIDANIIKWNGSYYMAYKDGTGTNGQGIKFATSTSLEPGSFKQYSDRTTDQRVEGPFVFQAIEEEKWIHYHDYFDEHRFGVSVTNDISSGEWEFLGKSTTMPTEDVRHGGVIKVTQDELNAILEGYKVVDTVTDIAKADAVSASVGTALEDLDLPETLEGTIKAGTTADIPIDWMPGNYNADKAGTYTLTGTVGDGYTLASGLSVTVKVTLETNEDDEKAADAVEALIDALPDPTTLDPEAVTDELKAQVDAAEKAYNDLSAAQQGLVSADHVTKLMLIIAAVDTGTEPDPGDDPIDPVDPSKVIPGDVDFSGVVDVADILKAKDLIMKEEWTPEELLAGDMNDSKSLDVGDILGIKTIIMS